MKTNRRIFLDCDGVLANFDDLAETILGEHPRGYEAKYSEEQFWDKLRGHGSFYRDMSVLPDGRILFEAVRHLNPIILTGCPKGGWAEEQKIAWAHEHFNGTKIITCPSRDKYLHMHEGDILVDDYDRYRQIWIDNGGIFVHYKNAEQAIEELRNHGVEVGPPPYQGVLFNLNRKFRQPPARQLSFEPENCVN